METAPLGRVETKQAEPGPLFRKHIAKIIVTYRVAGTVAVCSASSALAERQHFCRAKVI